MNKYNLWGILFCSFGAFFYGYDSGLTTSIIAYPEFISYFNFNSTTLGALGSSYYAGQTVGSLLNAWLPHKFGRLNTVRIACVISLLGCGMQTGAQSLGVLLAGRAIGGLACGLVFALCPTYASEVSPAHVRGRFGGLYNVNINVSYAITEWMGLGFAYLSGTQVKFRIFLGLQLLIAMIMLTGSIWMPESPRWLIAHHQHEKALEVLRKLHGSQVHHEPGTSSPSSEEASSIESIAFYKRSFNQIEAQINLEAEQRHLGLFAILSRPSYRKRLYLIFFFFFFLFQQLTTIIPLQNYQTILYKSLGLKGKIPLVLVGVWGTVGVIFSIGGAYFFNKLGRRKSFFISISGILFGSVLLVVFWARYEAGGNTNRKLGGLALWSMFMYLIGYAWIMNSFGYTYPPEILPMETRATGMALGFGIKMAIVIMLVQVTPVAVEDISWRYFLIFVFLDAVFLVVFYYFFPETAGIPLEEVGRIFGDEVAVTLADAGRKDVDENVEEKVGLDGEKDAARESVEMAEEVSAARG